MASGAKNIEVIDNLKLNMNDPNFYKKYDKLPK